MALRWASLAALLWLVLCSQPVFAPLSFAQDAPPSGRGANAGQVLLESNTCRGVDPTELHDLVSLELAPRTVVLPGVAPEGDALLRVQLRCTADDARIVVLDDAERRQELMLDLSSIEPPARARLIALSLSELLATAELEPAPALLIEPATNDQTLSRSRWDPDGTGWVGAGMASQGRPRLIAASLQSGLALSLGRLPLALMVELQAQRGAQDVRNGRVIVWTTSGSMGTMVQLHAGRLDLGLSGGARLGYAGLRGDAETSQTSVAGHLVSGLWWGPTLGASATVRLVGRLGLRAGVDLSWVARAVQGLDASGARVYALEGWLVHASLGVALRLPALRVGRAQ